jgi:WD40 repeat protein/serine/threonine protein kinase
MSEPRHVGSEFWPPAIEALLDEACDRFEAACQQAGSSAPLPRIEDYLANLAGPERLALVEELIPLDMHYRRQRGEMFRPEEYGSRFPDLDSQWLAGAVEASQGLDEEAKRPLHTGPWPVAASTPPQHDTLPPAAEDANAEVQVPGYEVWGELGRGGMGVVYKARQKSLNRLVALKMILAGDHGTPEQDARFRAEAKAVARMQHPHIVQVYEIGEFAGRSFISLEYCPGGSLAERFQGQPQPAREAAELVRTLAGAVQHAHGHGIIHRDLKPANILLQKSFTTGDTEEHRGAAETSLPLRSSVSSVVKDFIPKITDFGLAKQLHASIGQTQSGVIVGTPSYMAPEQTAGRSKQVGPATDVYALGAILYEALTGRPPFRAATPLETLEQVRSQEPVSVRQLQPQVPKDLETICQKCLQKEPAKRYASAAALADDLGRFLAGKPIQARPVGSVERLWRWGQRNPMVASLTAAVLVLLVAVASIASVGYVRTTLALDGEAQQRAAAQAAEQQLGQQLYAAQINLMQQAWDTNQMGRLRTLLAEMEDYPDRAFEWYYWQRLCHLDLHTLIGHRAGVWAVAWSPDGKRLATGSADGTAKVWDVASGQGLLVLTHRSALNSVSWSWDCKRLATASADGTAKVWDAATGRELCTCKGHAGEVASVSWSPDGKRLATGSVDGTARVWDAADGRQLFSLKVHGSWAYSVAWSPDGERLATGNVDGTATVWNAVDGQELLPLKGHRDIVRSVSWSPDGKRLATGSVDATAKVWDAADGHELLTLKGHTAMVRSVPWSPDGKRLATASNDGTARVWDAVGGRELLLLKGHTRVVCDVCWSPDGMQLATAGYEGTVKVWDAVGDRGLVTIQAHTNGDRRLVPLQGPTNAVSALSWSPDGRRLATGSPDRTAKVWEVATGKLLAVQSHPDAVDSVSWSPDGERLAASSLDGTSKVWEPMGERPILTVKGRRISWSPDGTRLATVSEEGTAEVWNARNGRPLPGLKEGHHSVVSAVSWSPDSRRLATASADGTAIVWEVADRRKLAVLQGHSSAVSVVAWSPDGRRLATGSADMTARIWDAASGQTLITLRGHTHRVHSLFWSPDGNRLATASGDGTLKVWDASSGRELLGSMGGITSVAWSPDGKRLAFGCWDGTVKVWEAASKEAVEEWTLQDCALAEVLARNALLDPQAQGFIKSWLLLLPLPVASADRGAQALDKQQLLNEADLQPRLGKRIRVGERELMWREHRSPEAILDFQAALGRWTDRSVAYAVCYLESDRPRQLWLQVGSDDQAKLYVNGEMVYEFRSPRELHILDTVSVKLKQGTNTLVFKVVNETSTWEGCIRLVDEMGRPAEGIRVMLTPEP